MVFVETEMKGAFIVELERREDSRGFFARTFCTEEFRAHGLSDVMVQSNLSFNFRKGSVRGLHYQVPPATEAKLFRCTRGASFHVVVDARPASPSYLTHIGVELTAESRRALYVPEMCAAGYQALADDAEVAYMVSGFYSPEHERGLRYDDPALGIAWPLPVDDVSDKDRAWPLVERAPSGARG